MTLVLLTALSVWVLMLVMEAVDVGGFLVEGTDRGPRGRGDRLHGRCTWYLRRRSRKNR